MEQPSNQNHSQPRKAMFLLQMILKTTIQKLQMLYSLILLYMSFVCHSHVIHVYLYVTRMSSVCHSPCHPYVTRMSSVCHLHVLLCHPYITRMYSYVTRMSLVCSRMSSVCLFVCLFVYFSFSGT